MQLYSLSQLSTIAFLSQLSPNASFIAFCNRLYRKCHTEYLDGTCFVPIPWNLRFLFSACFWAFG